MKRFDHKVIADLVKEGSRVLDLGCGEGNLMSRLIEEKKCRCTGIEIDDKAIYSRLEKGLTVSHGDIDSGLSDFPSKRFDYVIMHESLQQILRPKESILEALRVGKQVIVGIPNFCHVAARTQIALGGHAPITKELPFEWYDTPNLRFLSLKDFEKFCRDNSIRIVRTVGIVDNKKVAFLPNLFANVGIYLLEKSS